MLEKLSWEEATPDIILSEALQRARVEATRDHIEGLGIVYTFYANMKKICSCF